MQITKNIEEEEEDSSTDESFGDSWLAKFDEDGNRLGWTKYLFPRDCTASSYSVL